MESNLEMYYSCGKYDVKINNTFALLRWCCSFSNTADTCRIIQDALLLFSHCVSCIIINIGKSSMHYVYCLSVRVEARLELILFILGGLPIYYRANTFTPTGDLELPVDLICMSRGCGMKPEHPERTHAAGTGTTQNFAQKSQRVHT